MTKFKRYCMIGLAGIGGGALIGVTGGLAAPLIGRFLQNTHECIVKVALKMDSILSSDPVETQNLFKGCHECSYCLQTTAL